MSLADELLADLGSDSETEDIVIQNEPNTGVTNGNGSGGEDVAMSEGQTNANAAADLAGAELTSENLAKSVVKNAINVKAASSLMTKLSPILDKIRVFQAGSNQQRQDSNTDLYSLMVEANDFSVEIDSEILVIYRVIEEHYKKRFHELASLILNPIQYTKAVKLIGNDVNSSISLKSEELHKILPKATAMVINMAAFENKGTPLSDAEVQQLMMECDLLLSLDSAKHEITEFVSSRLQEFAPNISEIVGSHTAAQLMGFAGGLKGLATTLPANIPSIGANKQVGIGLGQTTLRKQGYLYHSEIVQSVPPDRRTQAMRIISGRLVLAARVDLMQGSRDGSQGRAWREDIQTKLDKLLEPPENKGTKALPVPVDKKSKKRGGKRIRKFKEQFKQTELQKAANRMAFGKEEEEVLAYDQTIGLGMAGSKNSGAIRNIQLDSKTRAKMSKGMASRVHSMNESAANDISNGLQSSLSFTPASGIQLVDPSQRKPVTSSANSQDRWFSSGTFTSLRSTKNPSNGQGQFTVPAPPNTDTLKRKGSETGSLNSDPKKAKTG